MAFTITKPLAEHIKEYTLKVNQIASDRITTKYPVYKQLNNARTVEAVMMNAWIDDVRAMAQVAKLAINAASSITEVRAAIATFTDK
jgi:hypothetical protein